MATLRRFSPRERLPLASAADVGTTAVATRQDGPAAEGRRDPLTEDRAGPANPRGRTVPEGEPGSPLTMPIRRWGRAIWRVKDQLAEDHLGLVAAGVAFYGLLALVPALAGAVSIYGLVSDPTDITELARSLRGVLPGDVVTLVVEQLERITSGSNTALSAGAALALGISLWSSNRGTKAIFTGLNIAYNEREERNFIWLNLSSLGMTLAFLVATVVAVGAVAVLPSFLPETSLGRAVKDGLRWVGLGVGMMLLLSALYRWGPSRAEPRWQWVSVGSVAATLGWLVCSAGFSLYVEWFTNYNETFGALGGVAITVTWMWLSVWLMLVGAEINAELEHETLRDSTTGPPRPIGERGAFVADDVPPGSPHAST